MSLSLTLVLLLIPGSMFPKADKIVWFSDHFRKSDHTSILCRLAWPWLPCISHLSLIISKLFSCYALELTQTFPSSNREGLPFALHSSSQMSSYVA